MFSKHLLVYINSKVPFHEHLPPLGFTMFRRPWLVMLCIVLQPQYFHVSKTLYRTLRYTAIMQCSIRNNLWKLRLSLIFRLRNTGCMQGRADQRTKTSELPSNNISGIMIP
jgi:hypothetical protein